MANRHATDEIFEAWARWTHNGKLIAGYGSLMSKMIACQGHFNFGSSKGGQPLIDSIEARIEAALMQLAASDPHVVDVVRVEYGARRLSGLSAMATQAEKATALSISLKTYKRRLKKGRDYVSKAIQ